MGRLAREKRLLMEESNKKLLGESLEEQINLKDDSTSINAEIPIGQNDINTLKQAIGNFSNNPEALLPIALAFGGGLLITLITQIGVKVKDRRIEKILNALNIVLENEMSDEEIKCLTNSLSNVGAIRSMNSKRKSEKVIYWMSNCIGEERATDIKDKFDEAVNRIGEREGDEFATTKDRMENNREDRHTKRRDRKEEKYMNRIEKRN